MTAAVAGREARIAAIEARYAVTLPEDFRSYLGGDCPEQERHDAENTTWWGLDQIGSLPDAHPYAAAGELARLAVDKYLVFADYMVWCWAWAINCGDDEHRGKIAIIDGSADRFVAGSFRDFLQLYTVNPSDVF
ncbi:SMI1/KNR4 family protein [Asticcacaulis solisilvae]|uniref:SMI1/KNR4 family protein n=1 Tax=Asticcacaulis solisilvae TaxID=1217274 RepID=UPI003FD820C6